MMFVVAGTRHGKLIDMRVQYNLDAAMYLENAPPLVVLTTTVLGGFRGLIADVLWLRISHLQAKGDYFEVVQLADWVTKLEPWNTEIWSFHAWNMTYNISVIMAEEEDRWRWVYNGIQLLRDEGLLYNPGDSELYREVGWIFLHKIGAPIDEMHQYYKTMWAKEMTDLLGGGRPDLRNLSDSVRQRMEKDYKLIPEIMLELESKYGALDWRTPQAHAAYWTYRGLKLAEPGSASASRCELMLRQSIRYMPEDK